MSGLNDEYEQGNGNKTQVNTASLNSKLNTELINNPNAEITQVLSDDDIGAVLIKYADGNTKL